MEKTTLQPLPPNMLKHLGKVYWRDNFGHNHLPRGITFLWRASGVSLLGILECKET
jgi:hypothetical protein